jgi:hypothetical protein
MTITQAQLRDRYLQVIRSSTDADLLNHFETAVTNFQICHPGSPGRDVAVDHVRICRLEILARMGLGR